MKKKFLISIDTEGDNLWNWIPGNPVTTKNAKYLPRFQELCNQYGFKPTYLTNYEMARDPVFAEMGNRERKCGNCEIGMHLHAWNNPPKYALCDRQDTIPGLPYLIEYPAEVMEQKIAVMTELLEQTFETNILTHRAGRWATNGVYMRLLEKYGYRTDCSVTPLLDWTGNPGQSPDSCGTDYTDYPARPYKLPGSTLLEVPVTVKRDHRKIPNETRSLARSWKLWKRARKGYGHLWLRPNGSNLEDLLYLVNRVKKSPEDDYIMFMLHSSEFMPGGSPTFDSAEKIEKLYQDLEILFSEICKSFEGMTIGEYARSIENGVTR